MLDVSINLDKLLAMAPDGMRDDPFAMNEWLSKIVEQVKETFADLTPDEAFIHADVITVNKINLLPTRCESCGAPLTSTKSFKCDYCGSLLVQLTVVHSMR